MSASGHGLRSKSEREPFRFPRWGKQKKRENKYKSIYIEDEEIYFNRRLCFNSSGLSCPATADD